MIKLKKNILGIVLCTLTGLCFALGAFNLTKKSEAVYAAEINTVGDVIGTNKDFPNSIDNAWLEEVNPKRKIYADYSTYELAFFGTDGDYQVTFSISIWESIVKDATTNNYVCTWRDSDVTFIMNDGILSEIIVKSMWGDSCCNGTYAPPKTIADILNTVEFPSEKNAGWPSTDGNNVAYLNGSNLRFEDIDDSTTFHPISVNEITTSSNGKYIYEVTEMYPVKCTFTMTDGVLSGIETVSSFVPAVSGTYLAPHVHSIKETHSKVEATCLTAGHEVYYECDCGKYFSDEALTKEITDLTTWLAEGGDGYIAPLGHDFGGEVTYTWSHDPHYECTASRKCQRGGCDETQTEIAVGVYVMDTPATCLENEKGHFEATFTIDAFEKQSTAPNSYTKPDSALGHDFGGEVTYTWDGDKCTASWECQRSGCDGVQSEVASLDNGKTIFVTDTPATCLENEKGHYEATFTLPDFQKQVTSANSVVKPNTATGHHFSGTITYTWEGDKCTASWKCDHAGCSDTQTETVTGVYVKDTDATTESNEKGHYKATFSISEFGTKETAPNSVEIPDTKLPSGLSGGAIAGITVGAVAGAALISYAVMFAVYAKSGKGLKFLSKSFDWLKKLFKMK